MEDKRQHAINEQFPQEAVDTNKKINTIFLLPPPTLPQGANFAHQIPTLPSSLISCALPPLHLTSVASNADHTLPPIAFYDNIRENVLPPNTYYSAYHNEICNNFSSASPSQTSDFKVSSTSKTIASTSFTTDEERHQRRLELNRLAAKQSRERKKIYVSTLESRAYRLEEENAMLKSSIRHAGERLMSMNLGIADNHRLHLLIVDLKRKLH
ncbi:10616_t:CDS:1 [Ambispora gerdemannii]|uniref:10616_t:CDS:1 n=1 Tax=Ambispora gerdemannii TaxID=144530 RepID=A0A9N9CX35_9GLOM|nr:10616_t:CDS:1 [Ambispora gerdemannii]